MKLITFLLVLFVTLLVHCSAWGETSKTDSDVNPDTIIAKVFDKNIVIRDLNDTQLTILPGSYLPKPSQIDDEYRYKVMRYLISQEINLALDKQCNVSVSTSDLEAYTKFMSNVMDDFKLRHPGDKMVELQESSIKSMGQSEWRKHYRHKCLYEMYGGAVIFQQASPQEPVGALKAHLGKLTREGDLVIMRADFSQRFWQYFKRKHSFEVPSEKVDFSQPWWMKAKH
ncbi:MAG: hypothetical protein MK214_14445 [Thalassotalea sp.]|nr:hypothetical protein [Thalassotalea sp.]